MKTPISWLKEFVEIDMPLEKLADTMIMHGLEVEDIYRVYEQQDGIVVGKIEKIEKHQDADSLQICHVNVGKQIVVVTGADNVYEGMFCPVATDGAILPDGTRIETGELRGEMSFGMLCSGKELHLVEQDIQGACVDGILELDAKRFKSAIGKPFFTAAELDDDVIEFEVVANRGDCMSITGIAREIAAATGKTFVPPRIDVVETQENASDYCSVTIEDKTLCPRYIARVMKDIKIEDSPGWMRKRLIAAGMRPISNIVDITNYVMLELGQPLHAFDYASIFEGDIIVRRAKEKEKLVTLDDKERILEEDILVIADKKGATGIAGVMGGEDSEITEHTQMVLLESALFNGASIRRTSRKLGIFSESSQRFAKGVDICRSQLASDRAAQLFVELGCGKVLNGSIDILKEKIVQKEILIDPNRINLLLGLNLSVAAMQQALEKEAIETTLQEDKIHCTIPFYRQDLNIWEDLAEEIARVYGYDNIPSQPLYGTLLEGGRNKKQNAELLIRETLAGFGLFESMSLSFTGERALDEANIAKDDEKRNCIRLKNPLSEDYALLRTTLISSMMKALAHNMNNKVKEKALFEISNIYLPEKNEEGLPTEKQLLCMGTMGESFLTLKGCIEELLDVLGIRSLQLKEGGARYFHPTRKALLYLGDEKIGEMGQLHPDTLALLDIETTACIAELDMQRLYAHMQNEKTYQELPRYPALDRDLAIVVDKRVKSGDIINTITQAAGEFLETVKLFDVYEGEQLEEGKKSMAYTLLFRSNTGTLKDKQANIAMQSIASALKDEFHATIRGMEN